MLAIQGSSATSKTNQVRRDRRRRGEDNVAWLERQLAWLSEEAHPSGERAPSAPSHVLLLGGRSTVEFGLRVAQSQLRHDLTPSHWSHAALVRELTQPLASSVLIEVSLEPQFGFRAPPSTNGLQAALLERYADPRVTPNIAVLEVPVAADLWTATASRDYRPLLEEFAKQRVLTDIPAVMLRWLAYLWSAGSAGNPLLEGVGVPTATAIETLLGAAGYDLSPGLDSGASCPEAFWQTATWWHPYFKSHELPEIRGAAAVHDRLKVGDSRPPTGGGGTPPDLGL